MLEYLLVGYLICEIYRLITTNNREPPINQELVLITPAQRSNIFSNSTTAYDGLKAIEKKGVKVVYVENPMEDEEDVQTAVLNEN